MSRHQEIEPWQLTTHGRLFVASHVQKGIFAQVTALHFKDGVSDFDKPFVARFQEMYQDETDNLSVDPVKRLLAHAKLVHEIRESHETARFMGFASFVINIAEREQRYRLHEISADYLAVAALQPSEREFGSPTIVRKGEKRTMEQLHALTATDLIPTDLPPGEAYIVVGAAKILASAAGTVNPRQPNSVLYPNARLRIGS